MNDDENRTRDLGTATTLAVDTEGRTSDTNLDPLTGKPGAHPVGTGVGAAGGAVTGAAIGGTVAGPPGALIGAAVGGLAGGFAGKGIAEAVNPTEEDAYWRSNYANRPYAQGRSYDDLAPAYRYGWESRGRHADRTWDQAENDLERGWENVKGESKLKWHEAKDATRDAWNRVDNRDATSRHDNADRNSRDGRTGTPDFLKPRSVAAVPLPELHDPGTGRLDASRVAAFMGLTLKDMSRALNRNYSTLHKSPSASDLQSSLQSFERTLEILQEAFVERPAILAWLNHPHADLGRRTPVDVMLSGDYDAIEDMLNAALIGTPS